MKKGFTLPEILVAILIIAVLAVMAVPQYEKAVEKSRKAEVLATLKKLHESKMRMMDVVDMDVYADNHFGIRNLDFAIPCTNTLSASSTKCDTDAFTYCLRPNTTGSTKVKNAVCAIRRAGDYKDVAFIYYGEGEPDADARFVCKGNTAKCSVFGMSHTSSAPACSCS